MAARLVVPTRVDRANTATMMVGSTSARIVTARLAPMPPKAVPVSRAARARVTVPNASRPTTANRSAAGSNGSAVVTSGTTAATIRDVATSISGASRNGHPVPCGLAGWRRASLRRSRHGWHDAGTHPALQPGADLTHHPDQ